MRTAPTTSVRGRLALPLAALLLAAATLHAAPAEVSAREAIAQAVVARMGDGVTVEVITLSLPRGAPDRFVEARPDPAARLGRAIRFTLVPATGSRVVATATLRVVADHVVAGRVLTRGMTVAAEDVQVVRAELQHVPVRRLPTGEQVVGSRVLRPLPAAAVVVPGTIALRRAVEPGDRITAVAIAGDIRVSAEMTATDGGDPGDVIRVVNTGTRRSLRGRVIAEGLVEVGHAR